MCKAKGLQDLAQLSRLPKPAHQAIPALCPPGTDSADQAKGSLSQLENLPCPTDTHGGPIHDSSRAIHISDTLATDA